MAEQNCGWSSIRCLENDRIVRSGQFQHTRHSGNGDWACVCMCPCVQDACLRSCNLSFLRVPFSGMLHTQTRTHPDWKLTCRIFWNMKARYTIKLHGKLTILFPHPPISPFLSHFSRSLRRTLPFRFSFLNVSASLAIWLSFWNQNLDQDKVNRRTKTSKIQCHWSIQWLSLIQFGWVFRNLLQTIFISMANNSKANNFPNNKSETKQSAHRICK